MKTGIALVVLAAAGVAGCGGSDSPGAASGPTVSFVSPAANAEVDGAVTAEVTIDGFTVSGDHVGQTPMDGEGHIHFQMDGGKYDFPKYSGANGELAVKLKVDGTYSPSVAPTITYRNLPAGPHTLKAFLVDNVHVDLGPVAETTFTVKAGPVSFVSPAPGATVTGAVTAEVALDGFTINGANVGKAPVAGEGHLHFEMDGGTYDFPRYSGANGELAVTLNVDGKYSPSVAPTITYSNLPMGEHTLKVFLVDNVHVNTGPMAETTFTVE